VEGALGKLQIALDNQELAQQIIAIRPVEEIVYERVPVPVYNVTRDMANDIKAMWADSGVKASYARQSELQLHDSAEYFLEGIDRITDDKYTPNDQDLLRARVRTSGATEINFTVDDTPFRMVDVGGQKGERSKWMQCFQDVTAVLFCVAMSEYDLKMREDETVNRMHDSLQLFDDICNNKWFKQTAMILFLNKRDLFEMKIKTIDLNECFPEYTEGLDFDKASLFIKNKFLKANANPKKDIYVHITCATDTDNVRIVFNAVRDILLTKTFNQLGV